MVNGLVVYMAGAARCADSAMIKNRAFPKAHSSARQDRVFRISIEFDAGRHPKRSDSLPEIQAIPKNVRKPFLNEKLVIFDMK